MTKLVSAGVAELRHLLVKVPHEIWQRVFDQLDPVELVKLRLVSKSWKKISTLALSRREAICIDSSIHAKRGLPFFILHCHACKELCIARAYRLQPKSFMTKRAVPFLNRLVTLKLHSAIRLVKADFSFILTHSVSLLHLDLSGCHFSTGGQALEDTLGRSSKLRTLVLCDQHLPDSTAVAILHAPCLEHLDLGQRDGGSMISQRAAEQWLSCSGHASHSSRRRRRGLRQVDEKDQEMTLKYLNLASQHAVVYHITPHLLQLCPKLVCIDLSQNYYPDGLCDGLVQCKNLEAIKLDPIGPCSVRDEHLVGLAGSLSKLKALHLGACPVTNVGLAGLATASKSLVYFGIARNGRVSSRGVLRMAESLATVDQRTTAEIHVVRCPRVAHKTKGNRNLMARVESLGIKCVLDTERLMPNGTCESVPYEEWYNHIHRLLSQHFPHAMKTVEGNVEAYP